MSPSEITNLIFAASLLVGAITLAWATRTRLGEKMPPLLRWPTRLSFSLAVFLAAWSNTAYALWAMGVQLTIGTIERGIMGQQWWLGPTCILYAVFVYSNLKRQS